MVDAVVRVFFLVLRLSRNIWCMMVNLIASRDGIGSIDTVTDACTYGSIATISSGNKAGSLPSRAVATGIHHRECAVGSESTTAGQLRKDTDSDLPVALNTLVVHWSTVHSQKALYG